MPKLTKDEVHKISKDAWEAHKNPIIECKNAVGANDIVGLAWCEDLNEEYIQYAPLKSLQMEIDKCIDQRWCDSSYILEKMRLLTCHIADLYRMTPFEEPYKSACEMYRHKGKQSDHKMGCGSGCRGEGDKDGTMYRLRPRKQLRAELIRTPPNEG